MIKLNSEKTVKNTAITTISNTIEISIRQSINENDVPQPIKPIFYI